MWPIYAAGITRHFAPYIDDAAATATVFERMADSARPRSGAPITTET
jgi:hypothetical protein